MSNRQSRQSQMDFASGSNRIFVPLLVFALVAVVIFLRLFYLQVIVADEYSEMAEDSRTVSYYIEPRRGTIYDRNGVVLAISVESTTIYANPYEIENISDTATQLASVLGGEASDYIDCLTVEGTYYSIIERMADVSDGEAVEALGLDGIYFVTEWRREYPNGEIGGQIVGACTLVANSETNTETYVGMSGLELYYDDILSGEQGYYSAEVGAYGTTIPGAVIESVEAVDGQDIIISIDIELQQYVEERLLEDSDNLTANGGSAVVMDAETGEIYAAASMPYFNPADRSVVEEGATTLQCVTTLFEPGSVFKTVATLAILETDTMTPDTELFCPSSIEVDGYTITDSHDRDDTTYTLREILDQSSNIGMMLATEEMGFDVFYDKIIEYGLHTATGVDYPGEGEVGTDILGYLPSYDSWSSVTAYNISFGQGVSVTPLQITQFYAMLANDGVQCTPHFLVSLPQTGEVIEYETTQIIDDEEALTDIESMLESVVTDGTGTGAAIEGYNVAGKTSTAEIYDEENGGYLSGVYTLAFAGYLSDASTSLVCFVAAEEVPYQGVVTPIFQDIMTTAIERFDIYPE